MLREAEVTTLAANGDLTGRPAALLEQVLARDADNTEALWLSGLAARQSGDIDMARSYWRRLLKNGLPQEFEQTVRTQLQKLPRQGE